MGGPGCGSQQDRTCARWARTCSSSCPGATERRCSPATRCSCGGAGHTSVATTDGLYTFGDNTHGQLGTNSGTETPNPTPQRVEGLGSSAAIAAGGKHSLALTADGVYAFGWNSFGELGSAPDPDHDANPTPDLVAGLPAGTVTLVDAGQQDSFVVVSDG